MKKEELAQWVIDNRYPKSEKEKISDHEMYHTIVDNNPQLHHSPRHQRFNQTI